MPDTSGLLLERLQAKKTRDIKTKLKDRMVVKTAGLIFYYRTLVYY
jgi:hypothetical protein